MHPSRPSFIQRLSIESGQNASARELARLFFALYELVYRPGRQVFSAHLFGRCPLTVFTLEEKIESIDSPLLDEDIESSFLSSFELLGRVDCVHLSILMPMRECTIRVAIKCLTESLQEDGKLVRVAEKLKGLDTSTNTACF